MGLQEHWKFTKRGLQFFLKRFISCFWEKRFLLKNSPDTHRLLKHDNCSSQVHTKVNHFPINALLNILLLFNNKHVMVKKLLQLFIDKVNGDLFEAVIFENLKPCNIQHSTEVGLLQSVINEGVITFFNQPFENSVKDSSCNTSNSTSCLLTSLTFGNPFCSNLDAWLAECLDHSSSIDSKSSSNLARESVRSNFFTFCLVITTLGLEFNTSARHDTGSQSVASKFLIIVKSEYVECVFSVLQFFIVIN